MIEAIATAVTDCSTVGHAVVTGSIALTATALAVMAFALAYITRQLRSWRRWTRDE